MSARAPLCSFIHGARDRRAEGHLYFTLSLFWVDLILNMVYFPSQCWSFFFNQTHYVIHHHCHHSVFCSPSLGCFYVFKWMLAVCVVPVLSSVGCLLLLCFLYDFKYTPSSYWAGFLLCIGVPCLHLFSLVLTVSMFSSSLLINHVSLYYYFICLYSIFSSKTCAPCSLIAIFSLTTGLN